MINNESISGAEISACKNYRYKLWRIWDTTKPLVLFIMLNPSRAEAISNDPTIRRCIGFAKSFGYGGMYVGNLFAYRATDPSELYNIDHDIISNPINDDSLVDMAQMCSDIIFAWGADGCMQDRNKQVSNMFSDSYCFGVTQRGAPKHPLYLSKLSKLAIYIPHHDRSNRPFK